MSKYKTSSHSTYNINYHLVFVTKYRKKVLTDIIQIDLKLFLITKAIEYGANIKAIESMTDHVHIFIQVSPRIKLSDLVKKMKGSVSYLLRKKYQYLASLKAIWSPSYFAESIGHISEATIVQYINNQKTPKKKWKTIQMEQQS